MAINVNTYIQWMKNKIGKTYYSMTYRNGEWANGKQGFDCSSAVYYALISAGATSAGWSVNTEYEHDWLIKNGFELIAENSYWDAQAGDIFIWGKRGQSAGAGGHTGIFVDANNIVHQNYSANGMSIDNHDKIWAYGGYYYYAYRLKANNSTKVTATEVKTIETLAKEVLSGVYGIGDERKKALGSNYEAVQKKVNELLASNVQVTDNIDKLAQEVIAGKHGIGDARKQSLGSNYDAVQKRVNQILLGG